MRRLQQLVVTGVALAAASASGGDWPHWRGPGRDGVVPEVSGWPGGWPPRKLWAANVGKGCSSPILVRGRLYVTGWRDGQDTLRCFNAATGAELWKQSYRAPCYARFATGDEGEYGGPTSTPSFDPANGLLFTLGNDGDLRCWDANREGELVWAKNLYQEHRVPQRPFMGGGLRDYGYTSAPLVRDGLVIAEVGAPEGTVMAFDKRTGRRRWVSQYKGPAGHTGGLVPLKADGHDCLALLTAHDLLVLRVDPGHEGETFATTRWQTIFICNIATPAVVGNRVIVTSCHSHKESKLFEAAGGRLAEKWTSRIHAAASTPVFCGDRVFIINDAVQCVDLATGKLKWRGGSFGHGSAVLTSDRKLIVFGARKLVLLEPLADEYRELSRLDSVARATCYPHVTLADGVLCCKDKEGNLAVFSVAPGLRVTETPKPAQVELPTQAGPARRVTEGLVAAYTFDKAEAPGLRVQGGKLANGGLTFGADGIAETAEPPAKLVEACQKSNEITIEAWVAPANTTQKGPARIVTLSADPYKRNFTLGQEGGSYQVRLRTTRTGENGMNPALTSRGGVAARLSHVVYTRAADGKATIYIDGEAAASGTVPGDLSNWDTGFRFALGNELTSDRPWRGELRLVALYSRALTPKEIEMNHRAGPPR